MESPAASVARAEQAAREPARASDQAWAAESARESAASGPATFPSKSPSSIRYIPRLRLKATSNSPVESKIDLPTWAANTHIMNRSYSGIR